MATNGSSAPSSFAFNGRAYEFTDHSFDVVVVGAGGAGLRATLGCSQAGLKTACVTKVFPTRSHTVAAQGGISPHRSATWARTTGAGTCTIRSRAPTGSATRTRSNICAARHLQAVYRTRALRRAVQPHRGRQDLPARLRRHDHHFGEGGQAQRTCAAADRTGHAILHTLYGQSLRHTAEFFIEYFAIDLIMDEDGACRGVVALCLEDGTLHRFRATRPSWRRAATAAPISPAPRRTPAPATATPWCCAPVCRCRTWSSSSSIRRASTARACSSPKARAAKAAICVNSEGERFMERYAPSAKDLASRDVVSRSMTIEIREGRGVGAEGDHIYLHLDHLDPAVLARKAFARHFGIRAHLLRRRCDQASRSRCCRRCITTWAASRPTIWAR